jgi:hypothetical protein
MSLIFHFPNNSKLFSFWWSTNYLTWIILFHVRWKHNVQVIICFVIISYHVFQWHLSNCVLQLILNPFLWVTQCEGQIIFWYISHYHCDKLKIGCHGFLRFWSDQEACANMGTMHTKACVTLLNEHGTSVTRMSSEKFSFPPWILSWEDAFFAIYVCMHWHKETWVQK